MNNIPIVYILVLLLSSCSSIRMDDSVDLGDKYRYIQDYPQTIIYHETEKYNGTGVNVIDPIVKNYSFNDRYIIAKSQEEEIIKRDVSSKAPIHYWIIDKKENLHLVQPMDSASFYQRLKSLNIELSFTEH